MILTRLAQDETGATAVEYGLFVALISIAIMGALRATGNGFTGVFTTAATAMGG